MAGHSGIRSYLAGHLGSEFGSGSNFPGRFGSGSRSLSDVVTVPDLVTVRIFSDPAKFFDIFGHFRKNFVFKVGRYVPGIKVHFCPKIDLLTEKLCLYQGTFLPKRLILINFESGSESGS